MYLDSFFKKQKTFLRLVLIKSSRILIEMSLKKRDVFDKIFLYSTVYMYIHIYILLNNVITHV